jgi:cobalt-zinc-cadmium resistance protein CzcA
LENQTKVPSIKITPNIMNQSSYGIPYVATKELLQVGIGGKQVAEVVDGQLRYPVVMMFDGKWKESVQSLAQIPIASDAGQQTMLGSLLTIEQSKARNMISHENGQRRIIIQSYTDGR